MKLKKKILLTTLTLVLVFSMSACRLPGADKETLKSGTQITNTEFENELKSLVDISEYEFSDGVYNLTVENNFEYDRVFKLNKKTIDFKSATFKDLRKAKIVYDDILDTVKVPAKTESDYYFPVYNRVPMSAQAYNDSDKEIDLKKCKVKVLVLRKSSDPEVSYYKFNFSNGINEKSNWKNVIEKFGKPNSVYYTKNDNSLDIITINFLNDDYSLLFDFCPSANTFESITFTNSF